MTAPMTAWVVYMRADPDHSLALAVSWGVVRFLCPGLPEREPDTLRHTWRDGLGDEWVARRVEVTGS